MTHRILVLITGDPVPSALDRFGAFDHMFKRTANGGVGGEWTTLDLRDDPELPAPGEYHGVIVSGSAARIANDAAWIRRGIDYLRELHRTDVPTLGVCFGHQMLGEALGGRVSANPRGRELGTVKLLLHGDTPLLDGIREVPVNTSHLDSVVVLPAGAKVYAQTELEENALIHFGARTWGVQFHPEFDREIVHCYVRERSDALVAEGLDPNQIWSDAAETPLAARVIPNFIRRVVIGS
jgi:GMP synthase (glutamine-hydrolysing)